MMTGFVDPIVVMLGTLPTIDVAAVGPLGFGALGWMVLLAVRRSIRNEARESDRRLDPPAESGFDVRDAA